MHPANRKQNRTGGGIGKRGELGVGSPVTSEPLADVRPNSLSNLL